MSRATQLIAAALCGVLMVPATVPAQTPPSADPLVERLIRELECQPGQQCDAKVRTRSLVGTPPPDPRTEEGRRSLEQAARTRSLPASDVEVYFPLNSADLVPETRRTLDKMAQALKADKLAASNFSVVGHTDARGGDTYNQELSERRAKAVLDYLSGSGGIDTQRLTAWGRGKSELKNTNDPMSGVNRRVQLINTGAATGSPPPQQQQAEPAPSARPPSPPPASQPPPSQQRPTETRPNPNPPPPAAEPASKEEECRFVPGANTTVCSR